MPRRKKPIPQRLKKLESSDYIKIHDTNDDILVVTKQETKLVIKEMLEREYGLLSKRSLNKMEENITKLVEEKISTFEKDAESFINHRIDQMAEKICDMLIMRKFKEEVEKRAKELIIIKEKIKGNF